MTGFFIEVKLKQQLNLFDVLDQAEDEKPDDETALIFHRKDNKRWLVTLDAGEFLNIIEELYDD
jgi:hypothetical protein